MANENPKPDAKDAEIAALKAELEKAKKASPSTDAKLLAEAIGDAVAAALAGANGKSNPKAARKFTAPLADEHKGTKTYVIGPAGHFRNNRLYRAGDLITVTDERPAKDWKLAAPDQQKVKPAVKNPGRAADQNVG